MRFSGLFAHPIVLRPVDHFQYLPPSIFRSTRRELSLILSALMMEEF